MSDPSSSPSKGGSNTTRRNLPSWMISRQNDSENDNKKHKQGNLSGETSLKENKSRGQLSASTSGATNFSKLLEGVVFVLSGFVNPERGLLRSQALEMGAEYQADWNSNCTLLVCAFPNTPKYRQVESQCGTIVSKEWISKCYNKKKLIDIETYLMHAGKPWRKQSISHQAIQDQEPSASKKSQKQVEEVPAKPTPASSKKDVASSPYKDCFPASELKKWAADDFSKTIAWLESQDEKPDPSEIKKIAAEGILTCLQDAIELLKQEQEIQHISEQWNFVPRVVEELAKLKGSRDDLVPKKHLYKQAIACKRIYEKEFGNLDDLSVSNKKLKTCEGKREGKIKNEAPVVTSEYDSDETIEMTEEDIDQAYNTITLSLCKC